MTACNTISGGSSLTLTSTLPRHRDEMCCKTTVYVRSRAVPTSLVNKELWIANIYRQTRRRLTKGTEPMAGVDIETTTFCNRRCSYCPNSIFERGLKKNERRMPTSLFDHIIDELAGMNFRGRISPHLFGEPLADPRLVSLMRYAHNRVPGARLLIYTNGDFLTPALLDQLYKAGVRDYEITLHAGNADPGDRSFKRIDCLVQDARRDKKSINLVVRSGSDLKLWNRAGLIRINHEPPQPRCVLPDYSVTINYRGDVVICCNDYLGEITFGNVQNESLWDIWMKPEFVTLRRQLREKVYVLDICRRCVGILPSKDS